VLLAKEQALLSARLAPEACARLGRLAALGAVHPGGAPTIASPARAAPASRAASARALPARAKAAPAETTAAEDTTAEAAAAEAAAAEAGEPRTRIMSARAAR
jgi:hypothetical protein